MKNLTAKDPSCQEFSCRIVILEGVTWIFRRNKPAMLLNEFLQRKSNHEGTKGTKKEVAA